MTPAPDNHLLPVRQIALSQPLQWLRMGWRDCMSSPLASLLHGMLVAGGGLAILAAGQWHWLLLPGALSGFVLVGPILATGLYEQSRLLARGERPGVADAVNAWRRGTPALIGLGLMLTAAGTLWVLVSALLFRFFVNAHIADATAFVRYAVFTQGDWLFLLWLALGGAGSAIVFACTAVSPPLLVGRVVSLRSAVLTSVRAVGENPLPMVLWAGIIMAATALSMLTLMAGFIITIPVIGHATWHAYRDLVDASGAPLRNAP